MTVFLDNRTGGTVASALEDNIADGARVSLLSNSFSIYAYEKLKHALNRAKRVRLLLSPPLGVADKQSSMGQTFALHGLEQDRRLRNLLDAPRIARECAEWIGRNAEVRILRSGVQSAICIENGDGTFVIQGTPSFDTRGLGFTPARVPQMHTMFSGSAETAPMLSWFESLWSDTDLVHDGKEELLEQLKTIYAERSAEEIYYVILHTLFGDILQDFDEERIVRTRTGITDTVIWNKLYRFQRDGVLGAIDKIEKYNGCIIADSVGLGKTFEALAIIKYYELRNDRVLVLCPKKLRENWTLYTVNDRRNLFAADRFGYDVLNHTDLTRIRGYSGEINLETLNWGNYDLVVIDESHNFRNNPSSDGITRYSRLMEDIIKSGVKTKVLMLSATPVNNRMNDLKNQVAFITVGKDDALQSHGVSSIEATLRRAQQRFNDWLKLPASQRTTQQLLDSLNMGYFKLLDHLTIARSRKHIVKYYYREDTGDFPSREKPINIKADIDSKGEFPELREINRDIRRLNLSTYSPLKYVVPYKRAEYSRKYDKTVPSGSVFKQLDREQNLIHLMRVNLLKRMESSIHSFALTVDRLLQDVKTFIAILDSQDGVEVEELNIEEVDVDEDDFAPYEDDPLAVEIEVAVSSYLVMVCLTMFYHDQAGTATSISTANGSSSCFH